MKRKIIERIKENKAWLLLLLLIFIISVIRFLYVINGDYFTFLDEYQTFDVAAGFMHTGKLRFWDFHHQILDDEVYIRAWPHTLLLAGWFSIFGVSVVAGKVLSAVFGILFILSLFYITRKIYNNYYITVLSCLFVMTNSMVITVFRQIRMYSLWLLCMVWLMYYIFRMMTVTPETMTISENSGVWGRICRWWQCNLNFSIRYIIISVVLLILTYFVQVNTLVIGVGMCLFYLYLLLVKRERRYYTAFAFIIGIVVLAFLAFLLLPHYKGGYEEADLWGILAKYVSVREDVNERYWLWTKDFVHNKLLFKCAAFCMIPALLRGMRKKNAEETTAYDFSIYTLLVFGSTLLCFLYLLNRYYQARYMICVAPMIAILMAWGIVETCTMLAGIVGRKWGRLSGCICPAVSLVCIAALAVSVADQYTEVYANETICYHRQVYEIVRQDAEERLDKPPVPIIGFEFRDYYGVQVFSDYVTAQLDRKNDGWIWRRFAERYPEGYMLVESAKINGFPDVTKRFIQDYSERIAGVGLDTYNIEAVRYHFLDPEEMVEGNDVENLLSYENVGEGEEQSVLIRLNTRKLRKSAAIVFLNFDKGEMGSNQENNKLSCQLRLPQKDTDGIYTYRMKLPEGYGNALLDHEIMIYYKDGTLEEISCPIRD